MKGIVKIKIFEALILNLLKAYRIIMNNVLYVFIFLSILVSVCACEKRRNPAQYSSLLASQPDNLAIQKKDSVYLIARLGDTLASPGNKIKTATSHSLPDTFTIMGVGDIMMGTNFPNKSYLPSGSGSYLWKEAASLLKSADITFGNLEGTILNEGGERKTCNDPKLCYLFRSPEYLAKNLQKNGFDLISLANNHANDFGKIGRLNTQSVLDSLGIAHAGSIDQPYTIKRFGHLKVGFCAFAPNRGTVSIHQYKNIKEIMQHLDSLCDMVIASFHAGAEGSRHRHVTRKREYYYGENRGNVYDLAHLMIDNGADVVFGHGPHVVRAIEVYHKRLIAYSLGNFLTYKRFSLKGYAGEAPILELKTDVNGRFLAGRVHSFRQRYDSGLEIDPNLSSLKTIQQLSLKDFPENPIIIDDTGEIRYSE